VWPRLSSISLGVTRVEQAFFSEAWPPSFSFPVLSYLLAISSFAAVSPCERSGPRGTSLLVSPFGFFSLCQLVRQFRRCLSLFFTPFRRGRRRV